MSPRGCAAEAVHRVEIVIDRRVGPGVPCTEKKRGATGAGLSPVMNKPSPYTDAAGRHICELDAIEVKYGYRYTVHRDAADGRWTAVDSTGHHRIALERLTRYCEVVQRPDASGTGV